jgi:putative protease
VGHRSQFVGEVRAVQDGWAEVETKNKFSVGDTLEVIHPSGNRKLKLDQMKNENGQTITVAPGSPLKGWIPLQGPVEGALLARMF